MNSLFRKLTSLPASKVKKPKIVYPIVLSFDEHGECLGKGRVDGAAVINTKFRNGKVKVEILKEFKGFKEY